MANKLKGEVAFEVSDATYILVLSIDALIALEDQFDKSITQLMLMLRATQRLGIVRSMFFHALRARHPDITLEQAGELVGDVGVPMACDLLAQAVNLAFGIDPNADKGAAADAPADPPPAGGTGPAS